MTYLITLQQIRDASPCREGWTKLLKTLGNPTDYSLQVSIGDIAKSNGVDDALWCTRCIDDRRFVVGLIFPAIERASKHSTDQRVSDCIESLRKWLDVRPTIDLRAASYAASYAAADAARAAADAARAAAAYAAYAAYAAAYAAADAAYAAAYAAADAAYAAADAAYAAADAADAAERENQYRDILDRSPLHSLKDVDHA